MSNYAKVGFLHAGERAVVVGPETVNGTGQVCLDADSVRFLTNAQARELAAVLIEAADYSEAVQKEQEEWPLGRAPNSVRAFEWTDQAWRAARKLGGTSTEESSDG